MNFNVTQYITTLMPIILFIGAAAISLVMAMTIAFVVCVKE